MAEAAGFEPLTARLQGGCHAPQLTPACDFSQAIVHGGGRETLQVDSISHHDPHHVAAPMHLSLRRGQSTSRAANR